jgi:hypothetical protein
VNLYKVCCEPCDAAQMCCEDHSCCVECHFAFEEIHAFPHLPTHLAEQIRQEHNALHAAGYPKAEVLAHAEREMEIFRKYCPPDVLQQLDDDHAAYEAGTLGLQPGQERTMNRQAVAVGALNLNPPNCPPAPPGCINWYDYENKQCKIHCDKIGDDFDDLGRPAGPGGVAMPQAQAQPRGLPPKGPQPPPPDKCFYTLTTFGIDPKYPATIWGEIPKPLTYPNPPPFHQWKASSPTQTLLDWYTNVMYWRLKDKLLGTFPLQIDPNNPAHASAAKLWLALRDCIALGSPQVSAVPQKPGGYRPAPQPRRAAVRQMLKAKAGPTQPRTGKPYYESCPPTHYHNGYYCVPRPLAAPSHAQRGGGAPTPPELPRPTPKCTTKQIEDGCCDFDAGCWCPCPKGGTGKITRAGGLPVPTHPRMASQPVQAMAALASNPRGGGGGGGRGGGRGGRGGGRGGRGGGRGRHHGGRGRWRGWGGGGYPYWPYYYSYPTYQQETVQAEAGFDCVEFDDQGNCVVLKKQGANVDLAANPPTVKCNLTCPCPGPGCGTNFCCPSPTNYQAPGGGQQSGMRPQVRAAVQQHAAVRAPAPQRAAVVRTTAVAAAPARANPGTPQAGGVAPPDMRTRPQTPCPPGFQWVWHPTWKFWYCGNMKAPPGGGTNAPARPGPDRLATVQAQFRAAPTGARRTFL